jgi:hypothetical protein
MTKHLLTATAALCMLVAPALLAPARATAHVDVVSPSRVVHTVEGAVPTKYLLTH